MVQSVVREGDILCGLSYIITFTAPAISVRESTNQIGRDMCPCITSEGASMIEQWKLIGSLERYAERIREDSEQDEDSSQKAYKAGKADGLDMAGDLLRIMNGQQNDNRSNLKFKI